MSKIKKEKGITLVALVVTIIILLILSGIVITLITGNNGIFSRAEKSSQEYIKKEASETMNLKITSIQIGCYEEKQELPDLQYLADRLCEDEDMEYVMKKEAELGTTKEYLPKIDVADVSSIFVKMHKYPYEFEIDSSLRLASIDGTKIANNENEVTISKKEYEELVKANQELTQSNAELLKIKEEYEEMKNNMPKLLGVFTGWKESATWNDGGIDICVQKDDTMCTYSANKLTIKEKRKISYYYAIC